MKENPVHECHVISRSEYTDQKIACTISFPTPIGIPVKLWLNQHGNVVGIDFYRELTLEEEK